MAQGPGRWVTSVSPSGRLGGERPQRTRLRAITRREGRSGSLLRHHQGAGGCSPWPWAGGRSSSLGPSTLVWVWAAPRPGRAGGSLVWSVGDQGHVGTGPHHCHMNSALDLEQEAPAAPENGSRPSTVGTQGWGAGPALRQDPHPGATPMLLPLPQGNERTQGPVRGGKPLANLLHHPPPPPT